MGKRLKQEMLNNSRREPERTREIHKIKPYMENGRNEE